MRRVRPGQFVHLPAEERALLRQVCDSEVVFQIQLYDESGDERHLWRAWVEARATGELSPETAALLLPRLDAHATDRTTTERPDEREARAYKLLDYYRELSRQTSRNFTAAYRAVAARHDTTPDAIKQLVMEHEGRGQRGRNKKNR